MFVHAYLSLITSLFNPLERDLNSNTHQAGYPVNSALVF